MYRLVLSAAMAGASDEYTSHLVGVLLANCRRFPQMEPYCCSPSIIRQVASNPDKLPAHPSCVLAPFAGLPIPGQCLAGFYNASNAPAPTPNGFTSPAGIVCAIACLNGSSCLAAANLTRHNGTVPPGAPACAHTGYCCGQDPPLFPHSLPNTSGAMCAGAVADTPCPAGNYCPDTTLPPTRCPSGHYCPEGTLSPLPCPIFSVCGAGTATDIANFSGAVAIGVVAIFVRAPPRRRCAPAPPPIPPRRRFCWSRGSSSRTSRERAAPPSGRGGTSLFSSGPTRGGCRWQPCPSWTRCAPAPTARATSPPPPQSSRRAGA